MDTSLVLPYISLAVTGVMSLLYVSLKREALRLQNEGTNIKNMQNVIDALNEERQRFKNERDSSFEEREQFRKERDKSIVDYQKLVAQFNELKTDVRLLKESRIKNEDKIRSYNLALKARASCPMDKCAIHERLRELENNGKKY